MRIKSPRDRLADRNPFRIFACSPCRVDVLLAGLASHGNCRRDTALTKFHTGSIHPDCPGMTPWNMTRQGREKYGLGKSGSRAESDPVQRIFEIAQDFQRVSIYKQNYCGLSLTKCKGKLLLASFIQRLHAFAGLLRFLNHAGQRVGMHAEQLRGAAFMPAREKHGLAERFAAQLIEIQIRQPIGR